MQVYSIEQNCIVNDKDFIKTIPRILEAKMTKKYNKFKILRALCMLSTT